MIKNLLIGGAIIIGIIGVVTMAEHKDQNNTLENSTTPPSITAETTLEAPGNPTEQSGAPNEVTQNVPPQTQPAVTPPVQKAQGTTPTPVPVIAPTVPTTPSKAPYVATIYYDGSNFIPASVTIPESGTVLFENASDRLLWVAANPHPSHTRYALKTANDCIGSAFDQCKAMKRGETWSFTFTEVGEWKYHNHMRDFDQGEILVLTKEKYLEELKDTTN